MARLKFFVFALVALGLWGYHLTQVAPMAVAHSTEAAQAAVTGAAGPVAVALEAQKSLTQAVALKAATSNAVLLPAPKPKPEAPAAERFTAVRAAAAEGLAPEQAAALFVAVTNEAGTLWAKGEGDAAAEVPEGLDLAGVMAAGAAGATRAVDGVDYLLISAPLLQADKAEVKVGGSVIVGLPVLPAAAALEQARAALKLTSLSLLVDGKPVLTAGEKGDAEKVVATLKAGAIGALESGPLRQVGPLQLPLPQLTPELTWSIGARQAIAGTPFEVAASASSRAPLEALAEYEFFAVAALGGLLVLTLLWLIIMGGGSKDDAPAMVKPVMPAPPKRDEQPTLSTPEPAAPVAAPEASPDDFDFPTSSPSMLASSPPPPVAMTGEAPAYEPAADPFASIPEPAAPPPPPPPPPAPSATMDAPALQRPAANLFDDEEVGARTAAYPNRGGVSAPPPPPMSDPFALAAAQEAPPSGEEEPNPDATRVAAIPSELLNASRSASGNTTERPVFRPPTSAMPKVASIPPPSGAGDEERHFQEVFRDFVATREKCREPADGLTYDKFKAKLLKNKEQLVAKYQCKTVRFQVYVKDGKAALKATPVKD